MTTKKTKKVNFTASKLLLLLSTATTISAFSYSPAVLAAVNPANLVQAGYWYSDEDVRAILKNRLDQANSYVAPALPFESQVLLTDVVSDSVNEARNKGTALIPVNFSNTHWAALVIKRTNAGTLKVIYNDSFGSPIDGKANSRLLRDIIQQIDPTIETVDLQVRQQSDGSSCGAFTAENLIKIAELDISNLSNDQLKEFLTAINDATSIRNSHFYILYEGEGVFDMEELKPKAQVIGNELENQNRQLLQTISNVNRLIYDRLSNLNRTFLGVAAGDNNLNHGVWLQGFIGTAKDKGSISTGNSSNNTGSKSKLHGFLLGADTKIDEDTTIGIAFGHSQNKAKQYLSSILTNTDTINSNIVTLYGSRHIDDNMSVNANIAYGKAFIKRKNNINQRSNPSKQKGDLLGGAVIGNYHLYSTQSIAVTPRVGISYMQAKLKGYRDGSVKIASSRNQEIEITGGIVANYFYDTNSFTVIPEIRADYSQGIWQKGNKVKLSNLLDQTIITRKLSSSKGTFKFGTGLTVAGDVIELGGGYQHSIQGKSRNHIGHMKLRINF